MHQLTLAEIARGLADKKFSSEELTKVLLARIAQLDPQLNSFISLTEDLALQQAKAADARRANGESGALLGAPIAHKDLFCTQGIRTSCGSKMLDNFKAPYDATVVAKLAAAGAVTLGKTNMDEFAMGSANESSYYGAVKNPWNLEHVPGGSSGGSAAAVAARLLPAATGTDTGGSIRQPAALTNLTGLKPTYGRVSRWGMIAYASSLDQGGPLARTAEDCAILLQGMAGFDPQDSTSIDVDGQKAFGVRSLLWLFGTFAHGHLPCNGVESFDRCLGRRFGHKQCSFIPEPADPNEKTRPRPRFPYKLGT